LSIKPEKYYNECRAHSSLNTKTPATKSGAENNIISLNDFRWKKHANNLFSLPAAA